MYGYRPYGPVWGPAFFAGQAPGGDPTTSVLLAQQQQIDELKFQLSAMQQQPAQQQQPPQRPRPAPPRPRPEAPHQQAPQRRPPPPPPPRRAAPPQPQQPPTQQQQAPQGPPPPEHHGPDVAQVIGDVAKTAVSAVPMLAALLGDDPASAIPVNHVWATLGRVLSEASMQVRAQVPYAMQSELFTASILDRLAVLAATLATSDDHNAHAEFDELTRFLAVHPHSPRLSAFVAQHPDLVPLLSSGNHGTGCSVCDAQIASGALPTPYNTLVNDEQSMLAPVFGVMQQHGLGPLVDKWQALLPHTTGMLGRWDIVGQQDPLSAVRQQAATMLANIQAAPVTQMSDLLATQLAAISSPSSTPASIQKALAVIRSQGPGISGLATQLQAALPHAAAAGYWVMGLADATHAYRDPGQTDPLSPVREQAAAMLANIQTAQVTPMSDYLATQLAAIASPSSTISSIQNAIAHLRLQGPGISSLATQLQAALPHAAAAGYWVGQADPLGAVGAQPTAQRAHIQSAPHTPMSNALAAHLSAIASATSIAVAQGAIAAIRAQGPGISNLADDLQALLPQ